MVTENHVVEMTARGPEPEKVIEAHQEFVSHIEGGSSRMRALSLVTIAVAVLLAASYVVQLTIPYFTGETTVTVNLTDPGNVVTELVLLALALVWLYVGLRDFFFSNRMKKAIQEARTKEKAVEKQIAG